MIHLLKEIKELYESGQNIMAFLREKYGSQINTSEIIQASYDLQAGAYRKRYYENPERKDYYCELLAQRIEKLGKIDSLLMVGCGEAITLSLLLNNLKNIPGNIYAIDISISRLLYAKIFSQEQGVTQIHFVVADLFELPFPDDSFDLVLTNHSLEPNGGREQEALKELCRVSAKYVLINEPWYEYADDEGKNRMNRLGYVKYLDKYVNNLGFSITYSEKSEFSMNDQNPTGSLLVEKKIKNKQKIYYCCPSNNTKLTRKNNLLISDESFVMYPVVQQIPLLHKNNAILCYHNNLI